MSTEHDWDLIRNERGWRMNQSGIGPLPLATLFGAGAIALTMLLVPMLDTSGPQMSSYPVGVDPIATGSLKVGSSYVIRRSVLQASPKAVCVISANGSRSGDC